MVKTLAIILAILAITGLGTLAMWFRSDPESTHPSQRVGAPGSGESLLDVMAPLINTRPSDGNRVDLLENGDAIFPAMLQAIEQAEDSVHLLTYVYWTGDIAEQFVDALEDAAARGVTVRVLIDAFGGAPMPRELVKRLRASHCELSWFRPLQWHRPGHSTRRTHRKVLVVDGRVGFTGGVGIAEEWTGNGREEDQWRDDHFRVRGPAVADLQGAFVENWLAATGEVLLDEGLFPALAPAGETRAITINSSPEGKDSPLTLAFWTLVHLAEEELDLATPYFVPHPKLLDEIVAAAERGVRVRLLVPGDTNDSVMVRWASLALYPKLLDAGVQVHEYDATMMHVKLLVSDGRYGVIGSANLDNRSFELNHEQVMLVEDPALAAELQASFERDLGFARRVAPDEFEGISASKAWLASTGLALRSQL